MLLARQARVSFQVRILVCSIQAMFSGIESGYFFCFISMICIDYGF